MKRFVFSLIVAVPLTLMLAVVPARGYDPPPPPPPLPAHPIPTPPPPTAPLQPSITSATVMLRSGDRFTTVHTLHLGDRARFLVSWQVNERSSIGVTGKLEIVKGNTVLYRRALHGQSGSIGGILYADVHLASSSVVGRVTARFTIQLGGSVERTVHFRVLPTST